MTTAADLTGAELRILKAVAKKPAESPEVVRERTGLAKGVVYRKLRDLEARRLVSYDQPFGHGAAGAKLGRPTKTVEITDRGALVLASETRGANAKA